MSISQRNASVYDKHASFYAGHAYWRSDEEYLVQKYFTNKKGKLLVGGVGGVGRYRDSRRWVST